MLAIQYYIVHSIYSQQQINVQVYNGLNWVLSKVVK